MMKLEKGAFSFIHLWVQTFFEQLQPRRRPASNGGTTCVPVLAASSTTKFTKYSPRHPPGSVPVFATSSATYPTSARHVIHHKVYRSSPRHPPGGASVPVLASSFAS
jgi:hypothetical protein